MNKLISALVSGAILTGFLALLGFFGGIDNELIFQPIKASETIVTASQPPQPNKQAEPVREIVNTYVNRIPDAPGEPEVEVPVEEIEAIAKMLYGECNSSWVTTTKKAACAWVVCNRVDSEDPYFPDTIVEVIEQSGGFYGYDKNNPVTDELYELAKDVLTRWYSEYDGMPYGLSDDPDKHSGLFPYKNQYIVSCRHCYTGVVNHCEYCNKELPRGHLKCGCGTSKLIAEKEQQRKEQEMFEKAIKLKFDDEMAKNMEMYYSDNYPYNEGYFDDLDQFIQEWEDNHELDDLKPKYVWGTYSTGLSLDAYSILESACDDLHEDAFSNLSDIDVLQKYFDDWCKEQSGVTTYWQDTKYAIEIPWEQPD